MPVGQAHGFATLDFQGLFLLLVAKRCGVRLTGEARCHERKILTRKQEG
jgi:hypothetical protein